MNRKIKISFEIDGMTKEQTLIWNTSFEDLDDFLIALKLSINRALEKK